MAGTRKSRFEHKITLGTKLDGTPLRRSFYSNKSRAEARRKAEKFKLEFELENRYGVPAVETTPAFAVWARSAIETYKKPFVKANTYENNCRAPLEHHLIPHFGDRAIGSIRAADIQRYINEASERFAPETVKKDYTLLKFIFSTAVDNGYCDLNPVASTIRLPKPQTTVTKRAYTQEQYDIVYAFAKTHPHGLHIMMLMETGISRSELLGLRWVDLDLPNGQVHIKQGLVTMRDSDTEKWITESDGLKNRHRQRTIPLIDKELIRRLAERPRTISVGGSRTRGIPARRIDTEYVFYSTMGKAYQPNNWDKRIYKRFMAELHVAHPELPLLTAHELRHTRATLWLAQGIPPLMVAKLLGHKDLKMLVNVYDHTTAETLREVLLATKAEAMRKEDT